MSRITAVRLDGKPSSEEFLLRVSMPCTSAALAQPWVLNGRLCQRDTISRGPDGQPTAVMVTAPARRADNDYAIAMTTDPVAAPDFTPPDLSALRLRLNTVDGKARLCRPIGPRTLKYVTEDGPYIRTEAHWSRFESGSERIMGVWLFVSYRSDGLVSMTVEVSNAAGKATRNGLVGFNGAVYFDGIKIELPGGWEAIVDQERPCIDLPNGWFLKPLASGDHSMAPREHFHRRLVLHRADQHAAARELSVNLGHGFAEGRASYYQLGWGPARVRLPEIAETFHDWGPKGLAAAKQKMSKAVGKLENILSSGEHPGGLENVHTAALGWAHPIGINNAYAHGGWWIYPYPFHFQVRDELNYWTRTCAMHAEREAWWALDADDGHPLGQEDFGADGRMPWLIAHTMAKHLQIPGFESDQGQPFNVGECPYRAALDNYWPNDAAHGVRNTLSAKVLAFNMNDAYARHHLRSWAEGYILSTTSRPHDSWGFGNATTTVFECLPKAHANPGKGNLTGGRDAAWILETAATYYALADDTWRKAMAPWFEGQADIVRLSVLANGCGGGNGSGSHVHGVAMGTTPTNVTDAVEVMQVFEIGLFAHGVFTMLRAVFDGMSPEVEDGLASVITRSARYVHATQLHNNVPVDEQTEYPGSEQPPWYIGTRDHATQEPYTAPAPSYAGGGEGFHGHFHLLYAWMLDAHDLWYLQKLFNLFGGAGHRGDDYGLREAVGEGAWYADKAFIESSGYMDMLVHCAPAVREMQRLRVPSQGRPPARGETPDREPSRDPAPPVRERPVPEPPDPAPPARERPAPTERPDRGAGEDVSDTPARRPD